MNDKQLMSFITVADKGSFYKAAQVLYTTPQTLIQQMNQLEQEVDVRLFDRNNKGVALTLAGEAFYEGAQQILKFTSEMIDKSRNAANANREVIRIGMARHKTTILPIVCTEFSMRYPDIHIRVIETPETEWSSLLCDEKVDVIEGDVSKPLHGLQIDMTKLTREGRMCVMSPAHPLAQKEKVTLQDLSPYQVCVHSMAWMQSLNSRIRADAAAVRLEEKHCNVENVFNTCLNGGVFLIPHNYAFSFAPLVVRPLDIDLKWDFGIAYRRHHQPAVDKFIAVAKDIFKA